MEYDLVIIKNEILPFTRTWMDLEIIMLSETSQQRKKYYIMSLTCRILKQKTNSEIPTTSW